MTICKDKSIYFKYSYLGMLSINFYIKKNEIQKGKEKISLEKVQTIEAIFQVTGEAVTCLVYPRFLHENSMYSIENRLSYFFAKRII